MRHKNKWAIVFLALCLLWGGSGAQAQQETLPTDKAGWVKRLTAIKEIQNEDWNALYQFRNLDPEFTYAVIRELWGGKVSVTVKENLLQNFGSDYGDFVIGPNGLPANSPKINPHLLDILDLGAADANENARRTALNLSYNVAVHAFDTVDEYKAWRKETAGRPIADVARENYRRLFQRFIDAAPDARIKMLGQITRLSFSSGTYGTSINGKEVHGILAHGLTGIRREMALEMGLLDAVDSLLKPAPEPYPKDAPTHEQTAHEVLYFFMGFTPDAPYLAKIEPDVQAAIEAQQAAKPMARYETIWFLQNYPKSRWATDLLLKIVAECYPGDFSWMLTSALCARDDLRVVPSLIAVLEDSGVGEDQTIINSLKRLTGAMPEADADADWWRLWWRNNAGKFSPEVAALSVPRLKSLTISLVAIRRKKSLIEIDNDPRRAYWLISSGLIMTPEKAVKPHLITVGSGKSRYEIAQPVPDAPTEAPLIAPEKKPGLLVVLTDSMENIEAQKLRWQEIAAQAFDGKFLIALARSPHTESKQSPLWPLRPKDKTGTNAHPTTEELIAEIVRDAESKYPIHPDRVFLAGIGAGGSAVYSCSLEARTPFHGFLLLDALFRSSELPPLANAKNKRYYLLHHRDIGKTPFFIATAAQSALSKAGAIVQLIEYPTLPANAPSPDSDALAAAVRWLEK